MKKIFWVDMEMTGLDPDYAVILEFAGVVTDLGLEPLDRFQAVIYQPPEELEKMNEWNWETHTSSGLLTLVAKGKPLGQVERDVLAFLKPHFVEERPILAGNSIHQDRKFIDKYMKELSCFLHYRMIDVSSFKQVFKYIYDVNFSKNNTHRAFEDITASIEELKHYLSYFNLPTDPR